MAKTEKNENNSGQGTNIENSTIISKEARDTIQKRQEAIRKELKKKVPNFTKSQDLSSTKLTDLDLSKVQIPYGVDLSGVTVKDVIDPTKFDFAKDDLSGLTEEHLDMKQLISIGFSAFSFAAFSILAITGLIKSIRSKVKEIDVIEKQKISNNITSTTNTSVDKTSTTQTNVTGDNTTQYNKVDEYSKKRNNMKRKVNNSPYSVDQRQRTDVLESTKAISTKKSTLLLKNNPNYGKYFNSFNI